MRLECWSLALLALLTLHSVTTVYAQLERHTPGFPNVSLDALLNNVRLDPRLLNILGNVMRSAISGGLTDAELAKVISSTLTSGAPDEDVVTALNSLGKFYEFSESGMPISPDVLYRIVSSINDEDLHNELKTLIDKYLSGSITPQDIQSLLGRIESFYMPRNVSLKDVFAATETSRLVGRSIGYNDVGSLVEKVLDNIRLDEVVELKPEVIEGLEKILNAFKPPSKVIEPTSLTPSLGDISNAFTKSLSMPSIGFSAPSVGLTIPSLQFPGVDVTSLIYIAAPIAAVLCCIVLARLLKSFRIVRGLTSFVHQSITTAGSVGLRAAIRNYWIGVRFMETRYGVVRHPWETHREYLMRVLGVDRGKVFEGLTEAYELAKYAQVESKEVDERSDKFLNELVGGRR